MKAEIKFLYLCVHVFLILAFLVRPCYAGNETNKINLSLREKVGQLFIIRPESLNTAKTLEQINDNYKYGDVELNNLMRENLKKYPAGGFIIYGKNINDPEQLKKFVSDLKNSSSVIPFIAIDEEGGRIARIANHKKFNVKKFKSAEAIGKTENVKNAFNMAEYISSYLSEYGFNFNFAPVADVNTNPENIVIGDRAFGSNPETVSKMVSSYLDGLHANKILGCIKHFPGHGDTKGDTHSGYVAIYKTWDELLKNEIIPFKNNLNKTDSIMTAHITLKNVTSDDLPATLSREIITNAITHKNFFILININ